MELAERVARMMWEEFATEGTYDEDRHDDRGAYLALAQRIIDTVVSTQPTT